MSLIQKLFQKKTKQVNMTIIGLDKAGKTTMINYLMYGEFRPTLPTMGINVNTIKLPKINLQISDLGGQESFRSLWSQVNEKSDAVVYIVDSSDFDRFDETKKIFHEIIETQITDNIPVLILLNKIDIPWRISRLDFIKEFELSKLSEKINWSCYETSSKTGEGLLEAFSYFIDLLEDSA
ncbi:MAG: ADP-ribosylation factor family protein [Candidatus Thorarchaeota archaeon]